MLHKVEIAIVGGGLVGWTCALACLFARKKIALICPPPKTDNRTTAIWLQGIDFLHKLGVGELCHSHGEKIDALRIIDGSDRLFRAPETNFTAQEIGRQMLGINIKNKNLLAILQEKFSSAKNAMHINSLVKKFADNVLHLQNGDVVEAELILACDGKDSQIRKSCGISHKSWQYNQVALVGNFSHSLNHKNVSMEIHTNTGPLTQVPLPNNNKSYNSSLVWVVSPKQAQEKITANKNQLANELAEKMQFCLGEIKLNTLQSFPLQALSVSKLAHKNCILLGEAAHVFPPIGAQGFNLGLRDVAVFFELLASNDLNHLPQIYNSKRKADVLATTFSVDILNRSLLYDFLPIQMARTLGLAVLQKNAWARQKLMKKIMQI